MSDVKTLDAKIRNRYSMGCLGCEVISLDVSRLYEPDVETCIDSSLA